MRRARMLSLLAAVVLSQSAPQLDEAAAVRKLIDTQLISVTAGGGWGATFGRGGRTFTLFEPDWRTAFTLVPEAHELALRAYEASVIANRLLAIGSVLEVTGLAGATALLMVSVLAGPIAMATVLALALTCAGVVLVGSVFSILSVPHLIEAQHLSYAAVSTYNHGLTRLDGAPILTVPLGP